MADEEMKLKNRRGGGSDAPAFESPTPGAEDTSEDEQNKKKIKKEKKDSHKDKSEKKSRASSAHSSSSPPPQQQNTLPNRRAVAAAAAAAAGAGTEAEATTAVANADEDGKQKKSAVASKFMAALKKSKKGAGSDSENNAQSSDGGAIINRRTVLLNERRSSKSDSAANNNGDIIFSAASPTTASAPNNDNNDLLPTSPTGVFENSPIVNRRAVAAARKKEEEAAALAKKAAKKAAAKKASNDEEIFVGDDPEERMRQKKREERKKRRAERANGTKQGQKEDGTGAAGAGGEGKNVFRNIYEDEGEDLNTSVSSLGSFEDFDPNDIDRLKQRLGRVNTHDPRIIYDPQIDRIPMWVHRWSDLKYFTNLQERIASNPLDTVTGAVIRQLQQDLNNVDGFIREIQVGIEGGFGEQGSAHFEEKDTCEAFKKPLDGVKHRNKKPAPDMWKWPNAAMEHAQQLRSSIAKALEEAQNSIPIGFAPTEGMEGRQFAPLPRASGWSFESIMFRATMEELFAGDMVRHGQKGQKNLRVENAISKVPIVHKDFLIDDDGPRMHLDVLNFPDMLTPPIGREGPSKVRRSITVNINYMRLRSHERFSREHEAASEFLDAYERYRLLASNMTPGVKSRRFYEHMLRSIEHEDPPHPYLSVVQELHLRTCEMETSCLKAMLKAWQHVCAAREQQGGVAATKLEFSLAKTGEIEASVFNERVDNILDFTPVVSDIEIMGSPLQMGSSFQIALHGQLSSSQPSQFIGVTDRRGLNTLFTCVYKESFEMLANHDPVRFTAVLLDQKGAVLASVDIPPSLTHAQHLLEFKTQMQYNTAEGPRAVAGVIALSTTWTTVAGMTIEDIEKTFLKGEADPMDPRNDAMVRILGKYYIEQAAAAKRAEIAAKKENVSPNSKNNTNASAMQNTFSSVNKSAIGLSERSQVSLRATWEAIQPSELNSAEDSILNNETYKLTGMTPKMRLSERQRMLNRRWLISKGLLLAADAAEAKLVNTVIPASDVHAERMMKDMRQKEKELAREAELNGVVHVRKDGEGLLEWQQKIRNMRMTQAKKKKLKDHELQAQILILPPIPTPDKIVRKFFRWFVPRSPLNPEREDRLDVDVIRAQREQKVEDSRIIVHILKVSNLPSRDYSSNGVEIGTDGTRMFSELEPFVVATFIGSEAQTRVESGVSPAFFQSLELDFKPSDFEDSTLSLIDDDVCISFYDKVQVSLPPATMPQSTTANVTHFRLERRLLGTVKIPFYSLYESETASLEGQFDINMPRAICGYTRPKETPSAHLFVSLYPAILKAADEPETAEETLARLFTQPLTRDLYDLYVAAVQWRTSCRSMVKQVLSSNPLAKQRDIEPFVNNSKGDLTFICRYLSEVGVQPPPTVKNAGSAIRFVSLIPFVVDMIAWNDEKDVWSTLQEFMTMGAGDYEELAMLLVMFLRYLEPNEQTFLLLGTGRVFKQATFVLHSNGDQVNIIDPRTGCIYNIQDPRSGMEEVSMVVSHDQVWANVQLSGTPHRMVWNFSDRRYWIPMFNDVLQAKMATIPSVQRLSLDYSIVEKNRASDLEALTKREVKKALKAWRKDRQPTMQERVGTILREVLVEFEKERCEHANIAQHKYTDKHTTALGEFSAQYEGVGVPVNVGFKDTTFNELLMQLYETRVHEIGTDNAVFALGVYVKPYTGNVLSIWVYLIGLVDRDPYRRQ